MILFRKLKAVVPPVSACTLTTFSATPALADGFQRANTVMQKVSTGLHGLAAITITVAVIWIGYKTCGKARACRSAATSSLAAFNWRRQ